MKKTRNVYTDFLINNLNLFKNQQIKRNEGYVKSLNNDEHEQ